MHSMLYASIVTLIKPSWSKHKTVCIVVSIFAPVIGYFASLLNMYNGGWGDEASRFWCHFRIMYLSGHNTIRWAASSIADAALILSLPYEGSIWAATACLYSYYILASLELEKSELINSEKHGYDLELVHVHEMQSKRTKTVNANGVVACSLYAIPWLCTGWSFLIMLFQLCLCVNSYMYITSRQTFVVTDTQYDILFFVFRLAILWTYI